MTVAALGTGLAGCSFSVGTGSNNAAPTKPATNTTNSSTSAPKKDDKPKESLKDKKNDRREGQNREKQPGAQQLDLYLRRS